MGAGRRYSHNCEALPLWAAVLPLLTINCCYLVAIGLDHLPTCIPYLSGCTSVSSTGRLAPESLIFKAGMLPSAVIAILFWWRSAIFFGIGSESRFRLIAFRSLGVIAGVSLTLYALTLGYREDGYRLVRRIGIDGFAVSNFLAQALFILSYRHMRSDATEKLWRWLVALCAVLPVIAIAAEVAKGLGAPRHPTSSIAAWNAFVVLSAYYLVVSRLWRHHDFSADFRLSDSRSAGRAASPRL